MSPVKDEFGAYLATDSKAKGGKGSLAGTPVAVKDIIIVDNGLSSTAGSKILEPFVSPYDATVVQRLVAAGAVIPGKTNLDEFAMGSSTENSALGETTNPWDPTRVPGGSSGGSAVAVASGLVPLALGTDTGGSIRQPAAFCGVVGLKPTYGRVSRYGAIALASSLDQIGTFSWTVEESAKLLGVIAGYDPRDATSVDEQVPDYTKALTGSVKGLKLGLPKEYFSDGMQPEVEQVVRAAAGDLEQAGAKLVDISLPHTKYAVAVYYIVLPAEASANLARYDGIRYGYSAETDKNIDIENLEDVYYETRARGFGPEVKRRIMLGAYALSAGYYDAYYKKAMQVRTLIKEDFDKAFKKVDVILTPTTPTTAFKRGEKVDDPLQMYLNDIFTVPANLAGIPGVSVPAGFDKQGLPIGLQMLGPQWGEETILRVAHAYEQQHNHRLKTLPTVTGFRKNRRGPAKGGGWYTKRPGGQRG